MLEGKGKPRLFVVSTGTRRSEPSDARPAPSAEAWRLIEDVVLLHPGWDDRRGAEVSALTAYVAGLEAALVEIRDMDWVEACLDPQWARRRALAALARLGAEP